MGRRTKRAALAAVGVGLVWPAVAWADKVITADPSNRYGTPEITMDQGEKLTFRNNDIAGHDVTANTKGPDGKPLFSTPIINRGESAFVEGSQYLTTGHYQFLCTLHTNMKGTVHVTGNGTPQPRPGAAPAPGAPAPGAAAADKQAPELELAIMSRAMRAVRRSRRLRLRVSLNEGGHVRLRAVARPRAGAKIVTFATGTVHMTSAGTRNVQLRLTRRGRRALTRNRRLAVVVIGKATDNAGNPVTTEHGRTLGLKR
jgi:plastocyanin